VTVGYAGRQERYLEARTGAWAKVAGQWGGGQYTCWQGVTGRLSQAPGLRWHGGGCGRWGSEHCAVGTGMPAEAWGGREGPDRRLG